LPLIPKGFFPELMYKENQAEPANQGSPERLSFKGDRLPTALFVTTSADGVVLCPVNCVNFVDSAGGLDGDKLRAIFGGCGWNCCGVVSFHSEVSISHSWSRSSTHYKCMSINNEFRLLFFCNV